ncbi:hypothetical protein ISN44_As03g008520 [Arabidopsis suecica]|uniref:Uncharacterized protein n=1 Tax=Arabidopsis suecica TaxID=45249 RepID=A0A8T2F403_ARASU|nr:hypothetical protein ISN44_As03g008520 [Arabidopsis suecica]
MSGVIFEPFEEVKRAYLAIPITALVSVARQRYAQACEAAVNEQIKLVVQWLRQCLVRVPCHVCVFRQRRHNS